MKLGPGLLTALVCSSVACCAVVVASADAANGTLTGTLTGIPAEASADVVEAVSPQGVIGGVGTVGASGAYSLSLPTGTWLVTASALSGDSPLTALAPPLRVRAGHKARGHAAPLKASQAATRGLRAGSVVTIAPIVVQDERPPVVDGRIDYTGLVTNILFSRCATRGIKFVDTSETFRKYAQQELALSRAGRLATPFEYKPIKPQYRVETEFSGIEVSGISFGLGVHTSSDNEVALDKPLEVEERTHRDGVELESAPTDEELLNIVTKVAATLAQRICG
jgi:hypothetical protein